jgi:hypothetical protein
LHALVLLVLGAVLARPLAAQNPPDTSRTRRDTNTIVVPAGVTGADSARRDSLRADSTKGAALGRDARGVLLPADTTGDTLQAPLAYYPAPPAPDVGPQYRWDRDALFGSGAVTLLDFLEQVPGVTAFRAGWITLPTAGAYMGDVGAVRVWLDGLAIDPLDARTGGALQLDVIPIWTLEEIVIERAADELRVYLRSWRWERTTANTRTDVFTGDEDTNMYRGLFAKRYHNGASIQAGAQQFSANASRLGGDGDELDVFARVGWAHGPWSADAFVQRVRRDQDASQLLNVDFQRPSLLPGIAPLAGRWQQAYVRAGWGTADRGPWVQLLASTQLFAETTPPRATTGDTLGRFSTDSADTTRSRAQYVAAAGWTLGGLRALGEARYRVFRGERLFTPSGRLSLDTRRLSISARGEFRAPDEVYARDTLGVVLGNEERVRRCNPIVVIDPGRPEPGDVLHRFRLPDTCVGDVPRVSRVDATARVLPFSFFALTGAAGQAWWRRADAAQAEQPGEVRSARAEVGLRLFGLWFSGGGLWRDSSTIASPSVFGPEYRVDSVGSRRPVGEQRAVYGTIRGTIYKALKADAWAIQWETDSVPFRPKVQTRATLFVATNWLSRFPSGSFSVLLGATHEYRSYTYFPSLATRAGVERVPQVRMLSTLLELRILNATISWQQRNSLNRDLMLVPGLAMPGQTNLYGVRWDFYN